MLYQLRLEVSVKASKAEEAKLGTRLEKRLAKFASTSHYLFDSTECRVSVAMYHTREYNGTNDGSEAVEIEGQLRNLALTVKKSITDFPGAKVVLHKQVITELEL